MYYLNKIVGWVLSPLGILFLGLAFGGLLARAERTAWKRLGRWMVGLTLVLVWILGCGVTTRLIGVPLEGEEVEHGSAAVEGGSRNGGCVDAIVLLGGGMGAHEKCGRAEMFSGADRVWTAARVWRACGTQVKKIGEGEAWHLKIFCSGGGVEMSTVPLLVDLGVPREAITCLPQPRNTEEEAKRIAAEITEMKTRGEASATQHSTLNVQHSKSRVSLVTSAWHMPRAKMLFERAGLEVVPAPCDYEMTMIAERPLEFGDFLPNADSLLRNSYAAKEWVARFGYGLLRRWR